MRAATALRDERYVEVRRACGERSELTHPIDAGLEEGESVLFQSNAAFEGLSNTGRLQLTNRRLIWRPGGLRSPSNILLGRKAWAILLGDISSCKNQGFSFLVKTVAVDLYLRPYAWHPMYLWWKLTDRWVRAIDRVRGETQTGKTR